MRLTHGLVVATALAIAGCDGDKVIGTNVGGPTGCGQVSACGGDPTGTWVLTSDCLTSAGQAELNNTVDCAGGSIKFTSIDVLGSLTFNADGTYVATGLAQRASVRVVLPATCAAGGSCEGAEAGLQSKGVFETVSCSGSSTCTCNATSAPPPLTQTGEFTVAGNMLTLDGDGGFFCVEGTHLHLLSLTDLGAVGEDLVAVRE
jgi:hypothetical protein